MAAADDPPLLRALGGLSRSLVELGGDVGEGTREALAAAALGFTGKAPPALLGELLAAFRLPAEACPEEDVHLALTFVLAVKHLLKQKGALSPATPPAWQGLLPLQYAPALEEVAAKVRGACFVWEGGGTRGITGAPPRSTHPMRNAWHHTHRLRTARGRATSHGVIKAARLGELQARKGRACPRGMGTPPDPLAPDRFMLLGRRGPCCNLQNWSAGWRRGMGAQAGLQKQGGAGGRCARL